MIDLMLSVQANAQTSDPMRIVLNALLQALAVERLLPASGEIDRLSGEPRTVEPIPFERPDALLNLARLLEDEHYLIKSSLHPDHKIRINLLPQRLGADLILPASYNAGQERLLGRASSALLRFAENTNTKYTLDPLCGLDTRNFSYPRVRPPHKFPIVGESTIIDLIDKSFDGYSAMPEAIEHLRIGELPARTERREVGRLLLIDWIAGVDIKDIAKIRQQLSTREHWLLRNLGGTSRPGWNRSGDAEVEPIGATPHPVLTLYSPPLEVGFKAIHGAALDTEIQDLAQLIATWLRAGKVDELTPVMDILVVTDSRESALALRPLFAAAGVPHLVYTGEDGKMWDPFPDGEWAEAESSSGTD